MTEAANGCSKTNPDEALKLREEALAGYRKVSGPEDPSRLKAMLSLAISYRGANRLEEALKLLAEGLPLMRKVLGSEHRATLEAMNQLAASILLTRCKGPFAKRRHRPPTRARHPFQTK